MQLDVAAAVEATLEVARVEQGHPDACLIRRSWRTAKPIAFGSPNFAGPVVHVVELADEGEAGEHHLREDARASAR